jgi:hypothetical protein
MLHSYMNWTLAAPLRNLSGSISTFSSILPESCDPATSSLFALPRTTDHEFRLACIQPLSFLCFADSCCTMDACNPFSFYRLRTLSIAMGVYTLYPECFSRRATPHGARWAPLRLQQIRFYPLSFCAVADHCFHNEGVHPPSAIFSHLFTQTAPRERICAPIAQFLAPSRTEGCATTPSCPKRKGRVLCHTLAPRVFEGCVFHGRR